MNIPIIADTHFGARAHNKQVFETSMEFFEKQFFPWCLKNNVKDVIHLGDIVHNRNIIDLWILQELKTRFFRWFDDNDIKIHLLIGNHCTYFKNTTKYNFQTENLREFKNSIIYNESRVEKFGKYLIAMVPWQVNYEDTPFIKADIMCGHFDIKNVPMEKNMMSNHGLSQERFTDYKYVFSGHYHIKSKNNNIIYVGTQYQLTWNDFDVEKGFYVLQDDFKLKYIENKISPKYMKIIYTENDNEIVIKAVGDGSTKIITDKELIKIAKNNYLKLLVDKCENQAELDNIHNTLTIFSKNEFKVEVVNIREIIEDFDFESIEEEIQNESNVMSIIESYISGMKFDASISKEKLFQMIKEMDSKVKENSRKAL